MTKRSRSQVRTPGGIVDTWRHRSKRSRRQVRTPGGIVAATIVDRQDDVVPRRTTRRAGLDPASTGSGWWVLNQVHYRPTTSENGPFSAGLGFVIRGPIPAICDRPSAGCALAGSCWGGISNPEKSGLRFQI